MNLCVYIYIYISILFLYAYSFRLEWVAEMWERHYTNASMHLDSGTNKVVRTETLTWIFYGATSVPVFQVFDPLFFG